jgi:hypothetical protein
MASLVNGQCAHRWHGMGRCLELATVTRPMQRDALKRDEVIYDIPLCETHAQYFDQRPQRV